MQQTPEVPITDLQNERELLSVGNPQVANQDRFRAAREALKYAAVLPIQSPEPNFAHVNEKPVHRLMCYAAMAGHTNQEIADQFNVGTALVGTILRQPWARVFIAEEARRLGGAGIAEFLRAEQANSARVLIELRDNASTPANVRRDICESILDRTLGKAIQRTVTEATITSVDASVEAAKIDAELATLREQVHGRNPAAN
jgi:hypothetical protein